MNIRVIIVDDEQNAIANLQHKLALHCKGIEVVATASTIQQARTLIETAKFDVAFLDIQLFKDSIFTLIDSLDKINFHIIFVTAYDHFAIRAIKIEALDYLLKPLAKEDIISCYKKILKKVHHSALSNISQPMPEIAPRRIILRQGELVYVIMQTDVYYLKAKGFYTEVHFIHNSNPVTVLISKPISTLEKEYDSRIFFRIHKSYIVNVHEVKHIIKAEAIDVQLKNDTLLPIAKRRVSDFLKFINEVSL